MCRTKTKRKATSPYKSTLASNGAWAIADRATGEVLHANLSTKAASEIVNGAQAPAQAERLTWREQYETVHQPRYDYLSKAAA